MNNQEADRAIRLLCDGVAETLRYVRRTYALVLGAMLGAIALGLLKLLGF